MFEGLKKRRVLVTGASGGIGASMAELFASYGAAVGIHYCQNQSAAQALREGITRSGGQAECFQANLLSQSTCTALVQSFFHRFQGIDVLINNAGGVYGHRDFLGLDEESWDQTFALNVKAPFFLAKEVFSYMKAHGGGRIINISSIAAKYGGSSQTLHYGAAKAALDAVTVGLARAGAPYHILVNSIRAGFIDTAFHQKLGRKSVAERISLIPLKQAGRPIDVARAALFLASKAGDYITGEIVTVSGGD